MLEQGVAISTDKRTSWAFKPICWKWECLQDGVSEMVDLVISLVPRLVGVCEFFTTELADVLGNFSIVQPLKAGQGSDVC